MTLCATIFNLTPDEYSVTAVAAYANGYNWQSTVSTGGYYGYFQSLFYIPVFWITNDGWLQYRLMLVINGILMSFVPVIAYYLSRKKFGVKKAASTLFALICGWYPCYMLLTKYTWNETMCGLLPWVFALLIYKSLDCESTVGKQIFSVLGALTAVAAYATHGRMLALIAAGVVLELVVYFSMNKTKIFCFGGFFGALAAGLVGDTLIKRFIQGVLWRVDEGKTPTNTIEKMISRLFSSGDGGVSLGENVSAEKFFDTVIGHLFYFISSTWGFGAICIAAVVTAIVMYYRHRSDVKISAGFSEFSEKSPDYSDKKTAVFMWFTLLAMGAIFFVSAAFKSTSSLFSARMDTVIYGRYTEVLYPIAIFAGLLIIYKNRFGLKQSLAALFIGAVINILTEIFVVPVVLGGERFVSAMILGIAPLRYGEAIKELPTGDTFMKIIITTMTLLFAWVLVRFIRKSGRKAYLFYAVPLAGLLMYTNVYCYASYTVPQSKNAVAGAEYMSSAISLIEDSGFDSITCCNLTRERYVKAQFLYPELDIQVVTSYTKLKNLDELPDIILSPKEDNLSLLLDGVYLIGDINSNVQIYAGTEKAVEWAKAKGLRVADGNIVKYTGSSIPSTTHVVKNGHDESADMNYASETEDSVSAVLPSGSAVYTNYMTLYRAGNYTFTVSGKNAGNGKISLTSNKGQNELDYTIVRSEDDTLIVKLTVSKKTENVRFKISCTGGEPIEVDYLTVEYGNTSAASEDDYADETAETT
jgi:hypothetical protein